ncbi:MAG: hypothetical protein D6722_24915 [Bacteroidetes bacterium]|nr:MAG: hypothetical protein D6722_24915 [Bacteroidota bacterium]
MEWLNDLKEKYSRRRIRNLDRTKEYPRDFVDLESARKVGLIINVGQHSEGDLTQILNYAQALLKRGKNLFVIELNFDKKSESQLSKRFPKVTFINPSKLNWLEYPTPQIEQEVQAVELDILLDFDDSEHMTSRYLCSMARAKTRTGVHREGFESCYELMITREEATEVKTMIKEFDYFLNMIDNGKKEKVQS